MKIKKILLYFCSSILLILLLVFSFWVNLSSEKLTPWMEYRANSMLPRGYRIQIENANTRSWGVEVEKIAIRQTASGMELLGLENIKFEMDPLSLIFNQGVPYSVELYGGSIEGVVKLLPVQEVLFSVKEVEPNRNLTLRKMNLVLSNPELNGTGKISITQPLQANLDLAVRQLTFSGDPKVTMLPFKLPETTFQTIQSTLMVSDSQLEVVLISKGDIGANLKGKVFGDLKRIHNSRLDLVLRGKMDDKYFESLGFIQQIVNGYRDPSGEIALKIAGNLRGPQINRLQ